MNTNINNLPNYLETLFDTLAEYSEERVTLVGAVAIEAALKRRIFQDGRASRGSLIAPKYSSNEGYFTRDYFTARPSAFVPTAKETLIKETTRVGKNSGITIRTTKISKKDTRTKVNKTMYVRDGYKGVRELQGRQTQKVDLKLSGSLEQNITNVRSGDKTLLVIKSQTEIKKSEDLEALYKKPIFAPSYTEQKACEDAMSKEVAKILTELL